ncbi:HutD/Ves family protein [Acidisoma sp. C75]
MSGWQILPRAGFRAAPWRNGGGITHEIASGQLPGGPPAAWHWRFSLAEIASDGPFSVFPDIDRLLTVVDGAGIDLALADAPPRRLGPGEDIEFPGEVAVACSLVAGPTRDLNLMVDRRVARLVPGRGARALEAPAGGVALVYAFEEVCLQAETGQVRIAAGDAARADGPLRAEWLSGRAIWARVEPHADERPRG